MQLEAWQRASDRTRHVVARQCFVPITSRLSPQVVLLPHHAADITPDTPAQEVLAHNALVKKTETKGSGSLATTKWSVHVSGLTTKVLPSKIFQEEWWCRGFRKLGPFHLQILLSPELPPHERQQKEDRLARAKETRHVTQTLMQHATSSINDKQLQQPDQAQQQGLLAGSNSVRQEPGTGLTAAVSASCAGAHNRNRNRSYSAVALPVEASLIGPPTPHISAPKALVCLGWARAFLPNSQLRKQAPAAQGAVTASESYSAAAAASGSQRPTASTAGASTAAKGPGPARSPKQRKQLPAAPVGATAAAAAAAAPGRSAAKPAAYTAQAPIKACKSTAAKAATAGAVDAELEGGLVERIASNTVPAPGRAGAPAPAAAPRPAKQRAQQARPAAAAPAAAGPQQGAQGMASAQQQQKRRGGAHVVAAAAAAQKRPLQRQGSGNQSDLSRQGSGTLSSPRQQQQQLVMQRQGSDTRKQAQAPPQQCLQRQASAPSALQQPLPAGKRPLSPTAAKQRPPAKKAAPFNLMAVLDDISKGVQSPPMLSPAQSQDGAQPMFCEQQNSAPLPLLQVQLPPPQQQQQAAPQQQQHQAAPQQQQVQRHELQLQVVSPKDPRLVQRQHMQQQQGQCRLGDNTSPVSPGSVQQLKQQQGAVGHSAPRDNRLSAQRAAAQGDFSSDPRRRPVSDREWAQQGPWAQGPHRGQLDRPGCSYGPAPGDFGPPGPLQLPGGRGRGPVREFQGGPGGLRDPQREDWERQGGAGGMGQGDRGRSHSRGRGRGAQQGRQRSRSPPPRLQLPGHAQQGRGAGGATAGTDCGDLASPDARWQQQQQRGHLRRRSSTASFDAPLCLDSPEPCSGLSSAGAKRRASNAHSAPHSELGRELELEFDLQDWLELDFSSPCGSNAVSRGGSPYRPTEQSPLRQPSPAASAGKGAARAASAGKSQQQQLATRGLAGQLPELASPRGTSGKPPASGGGSAAAAAGTGAAAAAGSRRSRAGAAPGAQGKAKAGGNSPRCANNAAGRAAQGNQQQPPQRPGAAGSKPKQLQSSAAAAAAGAAPAAARRPAQQAQQRPAATAATAKTAPSAAKAPSAPAFTAARAAGTAAGSPRGSPAPSDGSISVRITEGMDALKLPVRVLQASVPGLRLSQGALRQVQVVFVEEQQEGCAARVLAEPCQANASLAAGGIVGFFGQPLKVVLASEQLKGRTVIGCSPADKVCSISGGDKPCVAFIVQQPAAAAVGPSRLAPTMQQQAKQAAAQQQQQHMEQAAQAAVAAVWQPDALPVPAHAPAAATVLVPKVPAVQTATELPVETPQQHQKSQSQRQPTKAKANVDNSAALQQQVSIQVQTQMQQAAKRSVQTERNNPMQQQQQVAAVGLAAAAGKPAAAAAATAAAQDPSVEAAAKQVLAPNQQQAASLLPQANIAQQQQQQPTSIFTSGVQHASIIKPDPTPIIKPGPDPTTSQQLQASGSAAAGAAAGAPVLIKQEPVDLPHRQPQEQQVLPAGMEEGTAAAAIAAAAAALRASPATIGLQPIDCAPAGTGSADAAAAAANPRFEGAGEQCVDTLQPQPIQAPTVAAATAAAPPAAAIVAAVIESAGLGVEAPAANLQAPPALQHTSTTVSGRGLTGLRGASLQCNLSAPQRTDAPTAAADAAVTIKQEAAQLVQPAAPSTPSAALAQMTDSMGAPLAGDTLGQVGLGSCELSVPVAVVTAAQQSVAATAAAASTAATAAAAAATAVAVAAQSQQVPGAATVAAPGLGLVAGSSLPAAAGAGGSAAARTPALPRSPAVSEGQEGRAVPSPASSAGGAAAAAAGVVAIPGALVTVGSGISSSEPLCMPALPVAAAGAPDRFLLSDTVVNAVMDLVMFLHKHQDPTLDFVGCIEALQDLHEQPAAAERFMRMGYVALASAVRVNNATAAVTVVKRYLHKDNGPP